ncbi:MAG: efflux RND transporter permease subunit [Myxococcota bacterium]
MDPITQGFTVLNDKLLDTESRFFRRWAEFVLGHRALCLILTLLMTAGSLYQIKNHLRVDFDIESFLESKSETRASLDTFRDIFGRDDRFLVMVEGDVFSMPYLEKLKALHEELGVIDLELESAGQVRRIASAAPEQAPNPEPVAKATTAEDGDDDFGDFEDDDFGDFEDDSGDADEWAGLAGGTIVEEITSLVNIRQTRGREVMGADGVKATEIDVGELMLPWPTAEELPALKAAVLNDPTKVGAVINKDASLSLIMMRTQLMNEDDTLVVYEEVGRIAKKYESEDFRISLSGMPALTGSLRNLILSEFRMLFGLAMLTFIFVMAVLFRHPIGVISPLLIVALSAIWTFGLMATFDMPMTMLTNIMPSFIICIGMGDSVHTLSVYRDTRKAGVGNHEAIVHAIATTGTPILFTTITTIMGLLSFNVGTISAVSELGNAGAFGVSMALLHTLVTLPLLLSLNKTSLLGVKVSDQPDLIDRFVNGCSLISKRYQRGTLATALLFTIIAGVGISQIRVWHDPLSWIPESDNTKETFSVVDRELGGSSNVQLLIETPKGIKDLALIQGLARLEEHILEFEHPGPYEEVVGGVSSVLDFVRETNRALHGGDQAHYVVPKTQRELADILFLFESASPSQLRLMASTDLTITQMTIRLKWMEATSYLPFTQHVERGIEEHIGEVATIRPTGIAYTMLTTVSSLIKNVLRSFSVAVLVITLFMIILLRELRLGLIAMVPNLLPIVLVAGFMGYADIRIDMANLLIASIAIGIAVDDTIHFLHRYRVHKTAFGDMEAAIADSLSHAGRAMAGTTLILGLGFSVYFASVMKNLQNFGLLIALTVVLALLVDLVFGPALIRAVFKDTPDEEEQTGEGATG